MSSSVKRGDSFRIITRLVSKNKQLVSVLFIISFVLALAVFLEVESTDRMGKIGNLVGEGDRDKTLIEIFKFGGLLVLISFMKNLSSYFLTPTIKTIAKETAVEQIKICYEFPNERFERTNYGEYVQNIHRSSLALGDFIEIFIYKVIPFFLLLFISSIKFFNKFGIGGGIPFITMIVVYVSYTFFYTRQRMKYRKKVNRKENELSNILLEKLKNRDTTIALSMVDEELLTLDKQYETQQTYITKFARSLSKINIVQELIYRAFHIYMLFYAIYVVSGANDLNSFISLTGIFGVLWGHFFFLGYIVQVYLKAQVDLQYSYLFEGSFDMNESLREVEKIEELELRNVSLMNNMTEILTNINFTALPNTSYGIVGLNGTGKTSFIKMLLTFYAHTGDYRINGIPIDEFDNKSLFKRFSYASQDAQLFDTTIFANLKYGNSSDYTEITKLAKIFNFHHHILMKRWGYNYRIGYFGRNLSGGERQKLIILRTLLKKADIYFFDEPTANIDKGSEIFYIEKIIEVLKDRRVFAIIHNFNLLKYFDRVLYFNKKGLRCEGSHRELMETNEEYRQFIENR